MTDRELLELAAKAIGRQIAGWNDQHGVDVAVLDDNTFWQPLLVNSITDCMGDALRLAVKLRVTLDWLGDYELFTRPGGECLMHEEPDIYAAIRRAIVRAAAEIGKAKK